MNKKDKFPIADFHCDTVLPMQRGYDIGKRHDRNHIDIPRLIEGGVKLQVFATTSVYAEKPGDHFDNVSKQIELLKREFCRLSESIELCTCSDDIERVGSSGKIAAILAIEGGQALTNDPYKLERFYDEGVRIFTIAHELPLDWCTCHKEVDSKTRGLDDLGREIIAELNRLGMIIDLSHSGDKTTADVLGISSAPVIASHSNARALARHSRNLPDELITCIAKSGGLIGITFVNNFISDEFDKAYEQFWSLVPAEKLKELLKLYTSEISESEYQEALKRDFKFILEGERSYRHLRPGVKQIADHLDYVTKLAGIEHVGIGSDFDGISSTPTGLEDCSMVQNIPAELILHGYKKDDIHKIAYGNFLRLFKDVCR